MFLISSILEGRDCLGIMPTGGGKSLCYQIPAMTLPGLALVVSPLISLMNDQVAALRGSGVPAAAYNSSLSTEERRLVRSGLREGRLKLLYVSPERLESPPFLNSSTACTFPSSPSMRRTVSLSGARISGPATSASRTLSPGCPSAPSLRPSPQPPRPRSAAISYAFSASRGPRSSSPASTGPISSSTCSGPQKVRRTAPPRP